MDVGELDEGPKLDAPVPGRGRLLHRLAQYRLGALELTDLVEECAEMLDELRPARRARVQQRDRPLEQLHRRGKVAAPVGTGARGAEAARREGPEHAALFVERAEVPPVPERLLEVVSDDLLELADALADLVDRARSRSLVQVGPRLLQEPRVGDVANQDVAESEERSPTNSFSPCTTSCLRTSVRTCAFTDPPPARGGSPRPRRSRTP